MNFKATYHSIRQLTEKICQPLSIEDYVVQPVVDVSPPKWHLGHSTWFFETFILQPFVENYRVFNPDYNYVFNSYYETVGARVIRTDRGNLSRPTVDQIYTYRKHVDEAMDKFLSTSLDTEIQELLLLGFNHEQQHQELLRTDIKYILGHNPLFPPYCQGETLEETVPTNDKQFVSMEAGVYQVGFAGDGFCFDNELQPHPVYLPSYEISSALVTNGEYLQFMQAGGYENFRFWHAEGWDWVKAKKAVSPMYWHRIDNQWQQYTLQGLQVIDPKQPVCHVNYYEAAAFASWKEMRLPTEAEWEAAATQFDWGQRWEWTESAYLPYPGFTKKEGAIGEYNGKFMVSQMVLRGASVATSPHHSRISYRNFFYPYLQWQYTGIRLAK